MIADRGTAAHVERLVRNYRQVQRNEALEADNVRHDPFDHHFGRLHRPWEGSYTNPPEYL